MAALAVGLVVVLGIAAAFMVTRGKPGSTTAGNVPATQKALQKATPKASAKSPTGQSAAYTLKTPATAAGYPKLTPAPASVQNVATATAQAIRAQAVSGGGKVASQLAAYYQLSSGQVMSFAGYQGTFDPAKVLAAVASSGSGWQSFPAGPHGGALSCAPSAGTPGGTVCVWSTTTTLGITEFFSASGPEVVIKQSKAAEDTVNFRSDVETAKS